MKITRWIGDPSNRPSGPLIIEPLWQARCSFSTTILLATIVACALSFFTWGCLHIIRLGHWGLSAEQAFRYFVGFGAHGAMTALIGSIPVALCSVTQLNKREFGPFSISAALIFGAILPLALHAFTEISYFARTPNPVTFDLVYSTLFGLLVCDAIPGFLGGVFFFSAVISLSGPTTIPLFADGNSRRWSLRNMFAFKIPSNSPLASLEYSVSPDNQSATIIEPKNKVKIASEDDESLEKPLDKL